MSPRHGVSQAPVGLARVLANPVVTSPIVGITQPRHLDDAIAAVDPVAAAGTWGRPPSDAGAAGLRSLTCLAS